MVCMKEGKIVTFEVEREQRKGSRWILVYKVIESDRKKTNYCKSVACGKGESMLNDGFECLSLYSVLHALFWQ